MKIDGRKVDHAQLEKIRFAAVKAVQEGKTPTEAALAVGADVRRVCEWLALYRDGGWDALRSRTATGRPCKLNDEQASWVYDAVTKNTPQKFGLPYGLWTREQVQIIIRREFDMEVSLSTVGRLLKKRDLTCQRPVFRAYQQDPEEVQRWMNEEYPQIQEDARRENADIFFVDESGIRSDYHSGTTWGKRGETPIVQATGEHFHINMLSAISAFGVLIFMVVFCNVNRFVFLDFLKHLMRNRQTPLYVIIDKHTSHTAQVIKDYVSSQGGKLRIYFLPSYSPELNPDELVWNHVKNHGVGRRLAHTVQDLATAARGALRKLQRAPELVKGFFDHPETSYARA